MRSVGHTSAVEEVVLRFRRRVHMSIPGMILPQRTRPESQLPPQEPPVGLDHRAKKAASSSQASSNTSPEDPMGPRGSTHDRVSAISSADMRLSGMIGQNPQAHTTPSRGAGCALVQGGRIRATPLSSGASVAYRDVADQCRRDTLTEACNVGGSCPRSALPGIAAVDSCMRCNASPCHEHTSCLDAVGTISAEVVR